MESAPSRAAQPLTVPPGESPELLERGRGAAQLPGGQQGGLVLRCLLEGTAHARAEVWHVVHGHGQLREAGGSAGGIPQHTPAPTPCLQATPLTCTPGEVTDTLLGRTRTWTHLLSSSAKPCGAEAPGQAPSRQHLRGVSQSPSRICLGGSVQGSLGAWGEGDSGPSPQRLGPRGGGSACQLETAGGEGGGGRKGWAGRREHAGEGRCRPP